jgi:hypothetical protein
MAESHLQLNADATTATRKTTLWPTDKAAQQKVILSLFEQPNWSVSAIKNVSGSHWKVETHCGSFSWKINLFISSIRDESRQPDEFKMQLGSTYPESEEEGWINLVLGIYTIEDGINPTEYILSGYDIERYDFSTNPSLRGTRTSGLQKAKVFGMYVTDKSALFRPDFLYYYIETQSKKSLANFNESNSPKELNNLIYDQFSIALKTKPFLLLAGISGTGKSQKVQELAFMTCPKGEQFRPTDSTTPGNYCLIEVKPNWHDSTELLGYYSALSGKYELTNFIRFTYKAIQNPTVPFFLCLDEMNLAPVEQYFAEFLSVLETRKRVDDCINTQPLIDKKVFANCKLQEYVRTKEEGDIQIGANHFNMRTLYDSEEDTAIIEFLKENGLCLPDNLFVIGTVNMDDTTHQFSRKVIDRAFTIEMNGGKMEDMFSSESKALLEYRENPISIDSFKSKFVRAHEVLDDERYVKYSDCIKTGIPKLLGNSDGTAEPDSINGILNGTPFRVSYRVQNELVLYLSVLIENAGFPENIDNLVGEATLAILLEKVLPRIQGEQKQLETNGGKSNIMKDLKTFVEEHFSKSSNSEDTENSPLFLKVVGKLDEMDRKLNGYYTNFF